MTLQVTSELRKDVVTFLSDVEFEYVSWVKRPANRTPSPMAKSEDKMSFEVIQSIIQPIGKDVQKLKELYGEEWFNRVKLDNTTESDGTVRFIQKSDAEFDPETALAFRDAGHGLQFAVGKLAKTVKADDSCLRIPTQVKAEGDGMVGNLQVDPMGVTVAKDPNVNSEVTTSPVYVQDAYRDDGSRSFGDILYQKSAACTDGIRAEMELSTDNLSRREKIKSYIDNFGAAIMAALDKVDVGGLKADCTAPETEENAETETNNKSDGTVAEGEDEMNKEEITALFKDELMPSMLEAVKTTVKSELEAAAPPKEKTPEERMVELTEKLDKLLDGQKEIETIKTELAELTTKTEGLTHATATGQTGRDDGGAGTQDADPTTKGERSSWASIRPAQTSNLVIQ